MDWNKGYKANYYIKTVDPVTWRDLETYDLTGGNISKSQGSLQETASVNMVSIPDGTEAWIRIYLDARQGMDGERQAVFTGIMSAPARDWQGRLLSHRCECYSVLKPASDVKLRRGWYAPAGMDGAQIAAELLSVGAAPVEYAEAAPALKTSIIAEDNETNLTMAEKIVDSIDWRIRINGDGVISIEPKETSPRATFDSTQNDIVELSVSDRRDLFNCPNVFMATADDLTAIARDDDPESPLSTVSRGREVWMHENNCKLSENESIAQYSMRRLKEEQAPSHDVSYARRFCPDVTIGDAVRINLPAQEISGVFRIRSQQIEIGYGARTTEEAVEV